ncbi:hypothetical protein AK812_SmicGene6915 [Symbiodinium microadriaticum]|uniref:Uncharacterized protein n=1 Tax=Symbiodinium microadriaticum TaxID=2951 RepID=A0A1Q9EQ15_SYMMI|nr:hypothetical protein AK812_SmicGene6915 [Symbiodinium microadriaticum]
MLHRGLQALRRPGRGVTLGRTWWSPSRSASSLRDRLLPKLPKGYWLPTIAVGCFTIVSSGALFDLAIRWISRREEDSDEWMEDWDEQLLEDGGFPEDIAAALAAGRGLRQIHENVGTRHVFFIRHAQPGDGELAAQLGSLLLLLLLHLLFRALASRPVFAAAAAAAAGNSSRGPDERRGPR